MSGLPPDLELAVREAEREVKALTADLDVCEGAMVRMQAQSDRLQAEALELEAELEGELARAPELRAALEEAKRATAAASGAKQ